MKKIYDENYYGKNSGRIAKTRPISSGVIAKKKPEKQKDAMTELRKAFNAKKR